MDLELYTQPFCAPCARARQVVARVQELLPDLRVREYNVVNELERGRELGITSTPVIRLLRGGHQLFRADAVPTVKQLLAAIARYS